jgi:hypothetical protein
VKLSKEVVMRRERTERARQPSTGYDDLNDIVEQVFAALDGDDLANDGVPTRTRRPIEQRSVLQRRTSASVDGGDPEDSGEGGISSASFYPEEGAEQFFSDRPGAPDAEPRAERFRSSAGSLAIAADEEDFICQAAAWLARSSNAEGVLDRIRVAILEHNASPEAPARATGGDASGGSERVG